MSDLHPIFGEIVKDHLSIHERIANANPKLSRGLAPRIVDALRRGGDCCESEGYEKAFQTIYRVMCEVEALSPPGHPE